MKLLTFNCERSELNKSFLPLFRAYVSYSSPPRTFRTPEACGSFQIILDFQGFFFLLNYSSFE